MAPLKCSLECYQQPASKSMHPNPNPSTQLQRALLASFRSSSLPLGFEPRDRISKAPSPSPGSDSPPSSYSSEGMQGWVDQLSPYTTSSGDGYLYSRSNSVTTNSNKGQKKKWKPQAISYEDVPHSPPPPPPLLHLPPYPTQFQLPK